MRFILESSFSPSLLRESHISASSNGFVYSAYIAYSKHHHLTIRPDDVWFAILSQFGFYVKKNSEKLRDLMVAHQGTKEITIVDPEGSSSYGDLAQLLSLAIGSDVKDQKLLEWVTPSFSTTTNVDHAVASVLFMGTMQRYYRCRMILCCGLPSVTLLGELGDWEAILHRIDYLSQFGDQPSEFANMLRPILRHMILSFTHPTSKEVMTFWNTIATSVPLGSGGDSAISGWITAFCFWNEQGEVTSRNPWRDTVLDGENYPLIPVDDIPAGSASVPVEVKIHGEVFQCTMVAGSVGIQASSVAQQEIPAETMSNRSTEDESSPSKSDTYGLQAIQPVSGWWIFENKVGEGDEALA
jgi:hypothetical protein